MIKLIVIVLFAYFEFATPIRCYECNSMNNSMCLDPSLYDAETLNNFLRATECRQGVEAVAPEGNYNFFCRKIQQTILRKHHDPEVRVVRGCGWQRHHLPCYRADNEDHLETVCQCFSDDCNAASHLLSFATLVTAMVVATALF